ncbi:LysM peptidoglycan-binding domain-containing protein [Patulibacter sp. S7RM1-6]
MPPRSPFRFLAPGALLAVVVAVFLVVSADRSPRGSGTATASTTRTTATKQPKRRTYKVEAGDSLSGIAARYGLTVDQLLELNPKVDPQAIRAGQRLRLRD